MVHSIQFKHYNALEENDIAEADYLNHEGDSTYTVRLNGKNYTLHIDKETPDGFVVYYKGIKIEGKIKKPIDDLIESLGFNTATDKSYKEVQAPMPGLVLSLEVQKGTTVSKGDTLLILEAMKMENIVKSPTDGIIKSIEVQASEAVEKNQVLITFE